MGCRTWLTIAFDSKAKRDAFRKVASGKFLAKADLHPSASGRVPCVQQRKSGNLWVASSVGRAFDS